MTLIEYLHFNARNMLINLRFIKLKVKLCTIQLINCDLINFNIIEI